MRLFIFLFQFSVMALGLNCPRTVSTSPQLTEWLFQIGLGQCLIATSDQTRFPEEARALPKVGPLFQPAVERTFAQSPDLILVDRSSDERGYVRTMERLAIGVEHLDLHTVDGLLEASVRFSSRWGRSGSSELLLPTRESWKKLCDSKPLQGKTFIAFTWMEPAILFGQETFLSDLFAKVGAENIASVLPKENRYPKVSEEWIVTHRPDYVFFLNESEWTESQARAGVARWWPANPPRVLGLDPDRFSRVSLTAIQNMPALLSHLQGAE